MNCNTTREERLGMKDSIRRSALLAALLIGAGVLFVGIIPDLVWHNAAHHTAVHAMASPAAAIAGYLLIHRLLTTRAAAMAAAAGLESDLQSRERLLAENLQQRRLLETILAADPNGIAVVAGPDLRYHHANAAYRTFTPHPDQDPAGRSYADVWRATECAPTEALLRQVAETGTAVNRPVAGCDVNSAGERFLSAHLRRLAWEDGPAVLIVLQDETAVETARRHAAQASIEAQRRADELAAIIEAMVEGVIVFDAAGTPVRANPPAARLLGASLGHPDRSLMVRLQQMHRVEGGPLSHEELPSFRALQGETVRMVRFGVVDPDGRELIIQSSASPLLVDGQVAGAVAVWHDVTDRERAETQSRERAAQLAVLEERQHLSRELHDSVSQVLYGIALGSRTALTMLHSDQQRATEALEYVVGLTQLALAEMRAVIFDLRPDALAKDGLVAGLARQTAVIRARSGLTVREDLCAEPAAPLPAKEALYRIAQEALHNIVKHAHAKEIRVELRECDEGLRLEIADDGGGFDPARPFPGHLGLQTMRERAGQQGGTLAIHSAPGRGACVVAILPL